MKQFILASALLFTTTLCLAQTNKGTTVKTQTKVKTTTPAKATAPKGETPEEKAARLQKIDTRARAMTATMAKHINISLEQQVEVNRINRSSIEMAESARVKYIKNLRKMEKEIASIGASRLSRLKDVLTPEQFAKYNEKREEKMGIPKSDDKSKPAGQPQYDQ